MLSLIAVSIENDDFKHQGLITNNFERTLTPREALHAIGTFKDQYALDFINTEELRKLLDSDNE